jgi:lysyl-tRNA synthetase class 2
MSNEATRELFVTRARTIAEIRHRMDDHDFVEVETPVLQTLASGANARPFVTHHNALDCDLNLTISSELHLKRCVIGGLKNVYRLGKCFRNEGISYKHSPEFTMLEWMQSYADYMDVAQFTEEMVAGVAEQVLGTTEIECSGEAIDLSRPWRRVSMREAILEVTDIDVMTADSHQLAERLGERAYQHATHGQLTMALYSKLVEPTLIQPTMVLDFPISLLPLTKRHSEEPELAEHFDVVIGGIEIGCGDTELNDPREQRVRFADQRNQHCVKGERPQLLDEGFVQALEYGMPPTGGGGLGVDRLLMVLTGQETLREVVPFPTMRDRQ